MMKKLKTESYIHSYQGNEEVKIGSMYYLGELTDGTCDLEELLDSGVCVFWDGDDNIFVDFEIIEINEENLLDTIVEVIEVW